MAAPKYSRVIRGLRGQAATTKLLAYLTDADTRYQESNVGNGKPLPTTQKMYIRPFGFGVDNMEANNLMKDNFLVAINNNKTTYDAYKGQSLSGGDQIRDCFVEALTGDLRTFPVGAGFDPAHVIIRKDRRASGTKRKSKVTGLPYLDYGGSTLRLKFGAVVSATGKPDGRDFVAVSTQIKNAIEGLSTANDGTGSIKVSIKPEVFPVETTN